MLKYKFINPTLTKFGDLHRLYIFFVILFSFQKCVTPHFITLNFSILIPQTCLSLHTIYTPTLKN